MLTNGTASAKLIDSWSILFIDLLIVRGGVGGGGGWGLEAVAVVNK